MAITPTQVSTNVSHEKRVANMAEKKNDLEKISKQVSTQIKAEKWSDIEDMSTLSLAAISKNELHSLDKYFQDNTLLEGKLKHTMNTLESFKKKLQDLHRIYTHGEGIGNKNAHVNAQTHLQDIQNFLNTQFNGEYIFSGSKIDKAPIENLNTSNIEGGNPTDNYYKGDDFLLKQQIADNLNLEYGITAGHSAFQKVIASLHTVSGANPSINEFKTALGMLNEGRSELQNLLTDLAFNRKILKDNIELQSSTKIEVNKRLTKIVSTNEIESMTEMVKKSNNLNAIYRTNSILWKMSLLNHI